MNCARLIYNCFFTFIFYTVGLICSLAIICLSFPVAFLPESVRFSNRYYFVMMQLWSYILVRCAGVRYIVIGYENLPVYPHDPALIVANHASAFDIPLLELVLNRYPHLWMSKSLYAKIPLFGWMMSRINIAIDRRSVRAAVGSLSVAYQRVQGAPRHLVIFPEGTRHSDGKVHDFMSGFVILAKKLNRPVHPIALIGAHRVYPKGNWLVDSYGTVVTLVVGPRFMIHAEESDEQFVQRVRQWFSRAVMSPPAS